MRENEEGYNWFTGILTILINAFVIGVSVVVEIIATLQAGVDDAASKS